MNHDLVEKLAGLASRVNNMAILHTGETSRQLLEIQDNLAKLALLAIKMDLNQEQSSYQEALKGLNEAINYVGEANKDIEGTAEAIQLVVKAVDSVEKVLKKVAV